MESKSKKMKQDAFLKAFATTFGNVSLSCQLVGISRTIYYRWRKAESEADRKFCERLEEVEPEEVFKDFLESKLVERIKAGDTAAIIFALKTKAKDRGYTEQHINLNFDLQDLSLPQLLYLRELLDRGVPEMQAYLLALRHSLETSDESRPQ